MGKRSSFERLPRDSYATPAEAVAPLLPHLRPGLTYAEPCCGDGALIGHLDKAGHVCRFAADIDPRMEGAHTVNALTVARGSMGYAEAVITNPPWDRKILHPLISHLSAMLPCWLLFDAEWANTKQSIPFLPWCHKIVSIGRVRWIPGTTMTSKDSCCWYLFDQTTPRLTTGPVFFGRTPQ